MNDLESPIEGGGLAGGSFGIALQGRNRQMDAIRKVSPIHSKVIQLYIISLFQIGWFIAFNERNLAYNCALQIGIVFHGFGHQAGIDSTRLSSNLVLEFCSRIGDIWNNLTYIY